MKRAQQRCAWGHTPLAAGALALVPTLLLLHNASSYGSATSPPIMFERGGFNYIVDMSVATADDIVAVGGNALVRYDGVSWRLDKTFDQGVRWAAVDTKEGRGWAVGTPCASLRLAPGDAVYEIIPLTCNLNDVAVTQSGQAWAVGKESPASEERRSLILHFDGGAWSPVPHEYVRTMTAIWMLSDSYGWASGTDGGGNTVFYLWNGSSWKQAVSPTVPVPITAIHGVDEYNIWAVGGVGRLFGDSGSAVVILRYSGESWAVDWIEPTNAPGMLWDVKMVSPTDGWAVGEHYLVYRFDGDSWSLAEDFLGLSVGEDFLSVGVVAPDDIWIGGNLLSAIHYHGGTYTSWNGSRGFTRGITSVSLLPDGSGWAVGPGGPMLTRDGVGWRAEKAAPSAESMTDVVATSDGGVWTSVATSKPPGELAHYGGDEWEIVQSPSDYPVVDFSAITSDSIWAVASSSANQDLGADILHFDGSAWRQVYSIPDVELRGIHAIDENHVWAAGSVVLEYAKGTWSERTIPPLAGEGEGQAATRFFLDVAFDSPNHGWLIAGTYAVEYVFGQWRRTDFRFRFPQNRLREIALTSDGQAWIVGRTSNWYHDGLVWRRVEVKVAGTMPHSFETVDIVPGAERHDVWIAGQYDSVVRTVIPKRPSVHRAYLPLVSD